MTDILFSIRELFSAALIILITIILPLTLTVLNIRNLIAKKPFLKTFLLYFTLFFGMLLYGILYAGVFEPSGDWNEAVYPFQTHFSISSTYWLSFGLPVCVGILGLLLLGTIPVRRMPPLLSALCIAAVLLGNIMQVFFFLQLLGMESGAPVLLFFALYHWNLVMLSVQHVRLHIREQTKKLQQRNKPFRFKWTAKLCSFLSSASHMSLFSFFLLFPLMAVLEIVLVLCGQGFDGPVKAFTMTADWTFSQQTPPPPLEYDGHYLCTVAAGGHKRIVRPLRYGTRLGKPIVVNRQLCIANAFEELIHDRMPRFHRSVRRFYDTHGYPLSRNITTPFRADLVYLLMKPLEWLFLIVLYLFDTEPEERIGRQYR